jgi:hypothetical protein
MIFLESKNILGAGASVGSLIVIEDGSQVNAGAKLEN